MCRSLYSVYYMNFILCFITFLFFLLPQTQAVPPVLNYSGQIAVDGEPFNGAGFFKFALVNSGGNVTYWSNDGTSTAGSEPQASVSVPVSGGLYSLLLGNTAQGGMSAIDPTVFQQHSDAKLRVWFNDGTNGFQKVSPDRPFASVPYAFRAGSAVTASQIKNNTITTAQLNEQILKYLKPEITLAPQAPGLIFNGQTITLHSRAEGKYLNYQWYKNGQAIAGADKKRHVIEDVNGTRHDGNYTVVVSNDFGSITTQPTPLVVDGTPTSHTVASISMDMIFCPPGHLYDGQSDQ